MKETDLSITGIILAGGKSSRMGEDKAFTLFSGRPLIEVLIDKLSRIFNNLMIITNKPDLYKKYGIEIHTDLLKDHGSLGGIYTGLFYSKTNYNFICACDMPFLNENLIKFMLKKTESYDVLIPQYNARLEPLSAIYSKNCIAPIKEQLSKNNLKVTDFFSSCKVKTITENEIVAFDAIGKCFVNINTREDYHAICKGS